MYEDQLSIILIYLLNKFIKLDRLLINCLITIYLILSITDGSSVYVTLYYADGTTFKTGGLNPINEKFRTLTSKLDSFAK